jgi:hypothetical protein
LANDEKYVAEFGSSPEINASRFMSAGINSNENMTFSSSIK